MRARPAWAAGNGLLGRRNGRDKRFRRSLHGLRGLKFIFEEEGRGYIKSQPAWAAWIEIMIETLVDDSTGVAACMGCVD